MISPASFEAAVGRELGVEQEFDVADVDAVAGHQAVVDSRNDLGVVDPGHVAGIEVGEIEVFAFAIDLGMPAADAVGVQNDVAMLGRAADDDPIRLELDDLPGRLAVGTFQKCHAPSTPNPMVLGPCSWRFANLGRPEWLARRDAPNCAPLHFLQSGIRCDPHRAASPSTITLPYA